MNKQHLRIKEFYGTWDNAVKTQAGRAGTKKGVASRSNATTVEDAMTSALVDRYYDRIADVLSCYDLSVRLGTSRVIRVG